MLEIQFTNSEASDLLTTAIKKVWVYALNVKALLDWKESGIFDCWTGKTEKSKKKMLKLANSKSYVLLALFP